MVLCMYEEEATYMYEEEDTYMPITDGAFEGNNIFLRERMLTTAGHIYCSRDTFIANHLQVQNVPYRY
jgi:hypothetical protein